MWKELVQSLATDYKFSPPASTIEIAMAEKQLGVELPDDLRQLLLETDGIDGEYGLGLIWPLGRIVKDNLLFRTSEDFQELYMPFDPLLFFADAGNGDQFAFPILKHSIRQPNIFIWNHENDSRLWVAPSLAKYLEWWLNGTLKL